MAICIVCDYAAIYEGNFIPSLFELASKINEEKIIFCFPEQAKERKWIKKITDSGYKVFYFSRKKYFFLKDLRLICKSNAVNIIYTHFISQGLAKSIFPFSRRIKLVIHVHSDFSSNIKLPLKRRTIDYFFDHFVRRDSKYIYVSEDLFNKSKVKNKVYIPNAISKYRCKEINKNLFDDISSHFTKQTISFLVFAWSPFVKGLDVATKAFLDFNKDFPDSKLLVVCNKEDGKKKALDYLEKYNIRGIENLIFLEPIQNVYTYFNLCSAFISSSRSEGFSYSILEAIAIGKPVLMSDIVGTKWAEKFNCVFPYETENHKKLTELMKKIARKEYDQNFEPDSILVEETFSIDKWVNDVRAFLL